MSHPSQGSPTKFANTASLRSSSRDKYKPGQLILTSGLVDLKDSLLKPLFAPIFNLNPWLQGLIAVASLLLLWPIGVTFLLFAPPTAAVGAAVYVWRFGWPQLKADLKASNEALFGFSAESLALPRKLAMLSFYQALNAALWLTGLLLAFGANLNQSLTKQQSKLHVHEGDVVCADCKLKEQKDDAAVEKKKSKKVL